MSSLKPIRSCKWTSNDGKVNPIPNHNCMTEAVWFLPTISMSPAQLRGAVLASHKGSDGLTERISVTRVAHNKNAKMRAFLQKLGQQELSIDAKTMLPSALTFSIHPDEDAGRDIPVEIRYSDYRDVNGMKIPFRIERVVNGNTVLEITIQSATVNSGLQLAQ